MIRRNSRMWSIPGFNKTRYEGDGGGTGTGGDGSGNPPPKDPPPPTKTFTQERYGRRGTSENPGQERSAHY
jgi:hypothetical protein